MDFVTKIAENQQDSGECLIGAGAGDMVSEAGPSTQVD